jgi:hypothetical protein
VKPGDGDGQANFSQRRPQLCKRDVRLRFPNSEDVRRPLFNPMRPHIATLGLGSRVARIAPLCAPADRRRGRNAKTSRRSTADHPAIHRCQQPDTQIHRETLTHPCWPPSPAPIPNQKSRQRGIPQRFRTVENRSKKGLYPDLSGAPKGGLNFKLYAICDGKRRPLIMLLSEGQMSDYKGATLTINASLTGKAVLVHWSYDADWLRQALAERGITGCIPS